VAVDPRSVALLIPVFDDWDAVALLCHALDRACDGLTAVALHVYLVDDGSSIPLPVDAFAWPRDALGSITSVRLRRNVGHQRAIALGLAYLYDKTDASAVLVMDGDGEDRATDAIALVQRHISDPTRVIFASRRRRLEGLIFQAGYTLYRACHRALTGIEVRIGNFSIVPRHLVGAIVVSSESWSHYAASVVKARLPLTTVPMDRGDRLAGRTRMNYVTLVTHGLSAISVFRELVGSRLLLASSGLAVAGAVTLLGLLALAATGRVVLSERSSILLALLVLTGLQALAASFVVAFSILGGRDQSSFVPIRDYHYYIEAVVALNG
jgi:polyisoprenyl-phosphate glycosyltransferase